MLAIILQFIMNNLNITAIVGGIIGFFGILYNIKRKARKEGMNKILDEAKKAEFKRRERRAKINNDVANINARDKLRKDWSRNK